MFKLLIAFGPKSSVKAWATCYFVFCIIMCALSLPRKHKDDQFDHFTEDQKSLVRNAISKSIDYLQENNHGNTLGIEDYLN